MAELSAEPDPKDKTQNPCLTLRESSKQLRAANNRENHFWVGPRPWPKG